MKAYAPCPAPCAVGEKAVACLDHQHPRTGSDILGEDSAEVAVGSMKGIGMGHSSPGLDQTVACHTSVAAEIVLECRWSVH